MIITRVNVMHVYVCFVNYQLSFSNLFGENFTLAASPWPIIHAKCVQQDYQSIMHVFTCIIYYHRGVSY